MLIAQIQTEPSHVLANLALLAPELLVLVCKGPNLFLFIKFLIFMLFLNFNFLLYNYRCGRVYC